MAASGALLGLCVCVSFGPHLLVHVTNANSPQWGNTIIISLDYFNWNLSGGCNIREWYFDGDRLYIQTAICLYDSQNHLYRVEIAQLGPLSLSRRIKASVISPFEGTHGLLHGTYISECVTETIYAPIPASSAQHYGQWEKKIYRVTRGLYLCCLEKVFRFVGFLIPVARNYRWFHSILYIFFFRDFHGKKDGYDFFVFYIQIITIESAKTR